MALRNFSLRTQVLLALLATAAVSCVTVAVYAEWAADAALDRERTDALTAARSRARRQVGAYFENARAEVRLLGETPTLAEAVTAFAGAFEEAPPADDATRAALRGYYRREFLPRLVERDAPAHDAADPHDATFSGVAGGDADADTAAAARGDGDPLPENYLPADPRGVRLQAAFLPPEGRLDEAGEPVEVPVPEAYAAVHGRFHDYLSSVRREAGFHDVFLVAPDGGEILYSVQKETDFATDLTAGPHRGSNLAEVVRRAAASPVRGLTHFADFAPYAPSGFAPAAFLATPILDGPRVVGVLAVQVPVDRLDAAMTGGGAWRKEGLGDSGQVYLVGPDRTMRSNSRSFLENPGEYLERLAENGRPPREVEGVRRAGTTILRRTVDNPAVRAALAGEEGTMTVADYRGRPTLTSFAPLDLPNVRWAVIAEKDAAEALAPVRDLRKSLAVLTAAVVCGVTLLSVAAAAWLTHPLRKLTRAAEKVGAGQTDVRVRVRGRDEFARLGEAFNAMVKGVAAGREALAEQAAENERLLSAVLPEAVAVRVKNGERKIADSFADVTVLFAELTGFGRLTRRVDCKASVGMLNELVSAFDEAADQAGVEKVKTIGEGYMAVCGLSVPRLDHTRRAVEYALEMRQVVARFNLAHDLAGDRALGVRAGLSAGPVTAGVVGTRKFLYDLWGDTVTLAEDLRDAGEPGGVRVTKSVYDAVHDQFEFEPAPPLTLPAKGEVPAWELVGGATAPAGDAAGRVAAGASR